MANWILQANPTRYRLADALADDYHIRMWTVAQHRDDVAPGDQFALWASGSRGGVYAFGVVTAAADYVPEDDPYWVNTADADQPEWRIGIRIEEVLAEPILRTELANDPAFSGAVIMRMPGGRNPFPLSDAEWQALESHGARALAPPSASLGADIDSIQTARRASHQALAWTREEDILALNLFVHAGVINGGRFLSENDPRVIALSRELRGLPTHPGVPRDERFRNPSGVALKLMNFRAVERTVKQEQGIAGSEALPGGMPSFSALDRAVFEDYYRHDFRGLAEDAAAIRSAASAAPSTPTTGRPSGQDRPVEGAGATAYETTGTEGSSRSRSEHDLVSRYAIWLTGQGISAISRLYHVPGLTRPFLCDVYLPGKNALVEAKSSDERGNIRMAIGQLFDYQYLQGDQLHLGVLLPYAPATPIRDLLDSLQIGVIWPFGDGFRDSAGGTFTRS